MEFIRKYIDASTLMSLIPLPETLKNRKLEIMILPADEQQGITRKASEVAATVQALTGALPNTDLTLQDFREERLQKYEF